MVNEIKIKNYKSIEKLKLNLGQVNVLIGSNGCGKSNILEAITLGAAANNHKLDNEFLATRGIRITEPQLMRSAFDKENVDQAIEIGFDSIIFKIQNDNRPFSKWETKSARTDLDIFDRVNRGFPALFFSIPDFLIYAPENNKIRNFKEEAQIEPLGIHGEGLFKLLTVLTTEEISEIKENLSFIDWFEDFVIPNKLFSNEKRLKITDRFIDEEIDFFDQRSANEGFLYLLFYLTLFINQYSPKFFAIDNIDNSLNPKLCSALIKVLAKLAKKYDKQVILTTHNPAILDGLNLNDPLQKLFVVSRNAIGVTKVNAISKPKPSPNQEPVKLSEAFLRGYIGGLNKHHF